MDNFEKGKLYDLEELSKFSVINLKPTSFAIGNQVFHAGSWTQLCCELADVLIEFGILRKNQLPIYTHDKKDKYFINTEPKHSISHLDGWFKEIRSGIFVDTKYNADRNVLNLIHLFNHLGSNPKKIKVAVR